MYAVTPAEAARVNCSTFAVVGEVQQKRLKTAGVGSELVPDDFTQQDDGDVVLHLIRNTHKNTTLHETLAVYHK